MTKEAAKSVIVIGAGIVGATIAYRLTVAGAKVTIVDAASPGGVASPCSFGWINATYGCSRDYFNLRTHSMREWPALAGAAGNLAYRRTGNLYLHFDRVDHDTFHAEHTAWGYALDWIDADDIRKLEPNLIEAPARALKAPEEAAAEADDIARRLIEVCVQNGATTSWNTQVRGIVKEATRITGIETGKGILKADEVVLAAGAGVQDLAQTAGVTVAMRTPPGLLIRTKPHAPIITHMILTKGLHAKQRPDGVIVAGADFGGGNINENPEHGAHVLIERLKTAFRNTEQLELADYTLGLRPIPSDGLPVVGRPPGLHGLYVATMHSGVTLAPSVSLFAAEEMLTGKRNALLKPFGFERLAAADAQSPAMA